MEEPTISEFIDLLYDSEPKLTQVMRKSEMEQIYKDWLSELHSEACADKVERERTEFDLFDEERNPHIH